MNFKDSVYKPLQIALILLAGIFIGLLIAPSGFKPSLFSNSKLPITEQVLALIKTNYTDTISEDRLNKAGMEAMLNLLDPHSKYIPPYHTQMTDEFINGQFGGVGIEFYMLSDTPLVIRVVPGGPADKAGVKRGDRILIANDSLLCAKKRANDFIVKQMRGQADTDVSIKVLRNGKVLSLNITRAMVPSPSIPVYYMLNSNTGYIKLEHFSETTYTEFTQAMQDLKKRGLQKLVLDLRDNGGGLLEEATEILDEFLDEQKLMVYTKGRVFGKKEYKCRVAGVFETGELIVLTNENSASASEIIAGALQDYDRAIIVGRRTYGKGSVQQQYKLFDGGYLRLTIARYYTPSGRCIQKDYGKNHEDYYTEIFHRNDSALTHTDTTTYYTAKGRKVYAGGGIQPDVQINAGSDLESDFASASINLDRINQIALSYVTQNEKYLTDTYKTADEFIKSFVVSKEIITDAINNTNTVPTDLLEQKTELQIKAIIGRYLFGNETYFKLLQQNDDFIAAAVNC